MIARLIAGPIVVLTLIAAGAAPNQGRAHASTIASLPATARWIGPGSLYYVRSAPAADARVVGQVTPGTALRILAGTRGANVGGNPWWYRVRVGGATGYVSSNAVETTGVAGRPWTAVATSDGDATVTSVTARRAPHLTAPVAALYPLDARFTVLGRSDGDIAQGDDRVWYRIAQGALPPVYIYSPYLKFAGWGAVALAEPLLTAPSAVAIDAQTGRILYWRDGVARRRPASTVKLMTALVALNRLPLSARLRAPNDVLSVTTDVGGSSMGLQPGEILPLSDLLYGLLLPSGNDAAYTIAQGVAGSQTRFAALMNAMALQLGLRDTHYTNATGLDEAREYTSAIDLARLARYTLWHAPFIATIVRTQAYTINVGPGHPAFVLHSLDQLLGSYPGADGVKTGTTAQAGQNLVAAATRQGHQVIAVVLDATDRYADATALLDHAFAIQ